PTPPGPAARRILHRARTHPAPPLPPPTPHRTTPSILGHEHTLTHTITAFLNAATTNPTLTLGQHPDGHGGHTTPPPGALTYRPTATLVALVRATYTTCTFPYCTVPAARCDIDHIVPFDHTNPHTGGWTILANTHPLCPRHHHAKTLELWTCAKIDGNAIYWHNTTGLHHITPPTIGTVLIPDTYIHTRRPHHPPT
uniref:HNH endonuclease signature motif containing protein n=1 Tax=Rhodococcoides yunnanense TaxID=278209 RepID=UPI001475E69D